MIEKARVAVDMGALGVIGATLASWLPPIAAGFAIAWHVVQFYLLYKKSKNEH